MVGEEIEGEVEEGEALVGEEGAGVESILGWTLSFCRKRNTPIFVSGHLRRPRQELESA